MAHREPPETADDHAPFPFAAIWEDAGAQWPQLPDLWQDADRYRLLVDAVTMMRSDVPIITLELAKSLVLNLELVQSEAERLTEVTLLIAQRYFAPEYERALGSDPKTVKPVLKAIAKAARELNEALDRVPPTVAAALHFIRLADPDVLDRKGLTIDDVSREVHDLAIVSERFLVDCARGSGRGREFMRDSTIALAIEAAWQAGLNDLVVSWEPKPSLKGKAGSYIRGLFEHIRPRLSENSLASTVDKVRRKMKVSPR